MAAVLTVVAVLGLLIFVAVAINTFDTEEYVPAVGTAPPADVGSAAPDFDATPPPQASPPVGGVATGGGATAAGSTSVALPVFGGLAALALLAGARMLWRPRGA
ncbi:MAG TPA: hypothetical protein VG455_10970 [Acidimicrobiales bacterium]|nr:hypothetical protein [Acidimicrobiales bacterium]